MMDYVAFPKIGSIAQHSVLRSDFNISAGQAAKLMDERGVSSIVIGQEDSHYVFSVEDVLKHAHDGGDMSLLIANLPMRKISCISDDLSVLAALDMLEKEGQHYLGVINEKNVLVGIVTYTDILGSIDPTILMERKTIGEMVSRTDPVVFTPDWILEDVLHHFRTTDDAIIIVEENKPVGIITTRDIFPLLSSGGDVSQPLAYYMTMPVIVTTSHSSIHDALLQLKRNHIKRAIVVNELGVLTGVVPQTELIGFAYGSWANILRHHATELSELIGLLEEKNRTLEALSYTDALTGIGNRRMLHREMTNEIERIQRYRTPSFSLVLVDIDVFKQVNDQYGHDAGDKVLCGLSKQMTELIRKNDIAVRWGGEEFAVMLRNTPLVAARDFAERLRTLVEATKWIGDHPVTISIGVGEFLPQEREDTFFHRIDRALYRAKDAGRNRVEFDAG
ncbi:MAG: diguanylate cyclase [Gallionella sp.]|nr:diguanylate cyclase [Gallionella sp.]